MQSPFFCDILLNYDACDKKSNPKQEVKKMKILTILMMLILVGIVVFTDVFTELNEQQAKLIGSLITVVIVVFITYSIISNVSKIRKNSDEQLKLMKQQAQPINEPKIQLCDGCRCNFDKSELRKIDSGQMLCPGCINNLKNRR